MPQNEDIAFVQQKKNTASKIGDNIASRSKNTNRQLVKG
ncbi:hypothetical protein (plasmid) [Metabacillus dongyingensis]|nr:hypothetical protein [Metabacillus dongyingensis]